MLSNVPLAMDECCERPAKRQRRDYTKTITVVVGTKTWENTFTVPEDLLLLDSDWFRTTRRQPLTKHGARKLILPFESDATTFTIYLDWADTKEIIIDGTHAKYLTTKDFDGSNVYFEALVRLWLLAENLRSVQTRNDVMDVLIHIRIKTGWIPGIILVHLAWDKSKPESALCRFLLDAHASTPMVSDLERYYDEYPVGFMRSVHLQQMKQGSSGEASRWPEDIEKCLYHEHDEAHPPCT